MTLSQQEMLISVDIEADGPIPGDYSMLSLGACVVDNPKLSFYLELKPISDRFDPGTLAVSALDRGRLIIEGADPGVAMERFAGWLNQVCIEGSRPVFVAFNATYDWMFVHWYFEHFLGRDPFGISGWDIKAYYAGVARKRLWAETSKSKMDKQFLPTRAHTHNALDDAREQAEIFKLVRRIAGVS